MDDEEVDEIIGSNVRKLELLSCLNFTSSSFLMPFVWLILYRSENILFAAGGSLLGVFAVYLFSIGMELQPYGMVFRDAHKQRKNNRRQLWILGIFIFLNIGILILMADREFR